jgi:hypothetical protein
MYNLLFSTIIGLTALSSFSVSTDTPPSINAFTPGEGVKVMSLNYEIRGSEVYITLDLQVHNSLVSITSASHSYVEATDQLNQVIATVTNK